MNDDERSGFYRYYTAFKSWHQPKGLDDVDRFTNIFRKLRVPTGGRILEIGFGQGRLLDWATQHHYVVEGVEILPEMVEYARARGHIVHCGDIFDIDLSSQRFDLLAAIDVIEHFSLAEIMALFQSADKLLQARGQIVLQFPNAASPFSAPFQSGDITHKQALSKELIQQIAQPNGWVVVSYFNARVRSKHWLKQLRLLAAHLIRDIIEVFISFAYFGARYPLDPNIVVVLERTHK